MTRESTPIKTKIVVTIGPASSDQAVLRQFLKAGMNVARINTSHSDHEHITATIRTLRKVAREEDFHLGILLDLSGPKIRVGSLPSEGRLLEVGAQFTLGYGDGVDLAIRSQVEFKAVEENARVMLDDGRLELRVVEHLSSSALRVEVVYGGLLKNNKGVNFPGVALGVPSLTTVDEGNLRHGLTQGIDWVAQSFVRSASDRQPIEQIFSEVGIKIPVMAKIEKPEAVAQLDDIIEAYDGIMVARGDLGVEMPLDEVPLIQKRIIRRCNDTGKPVITATQLLDSMVSAPSPTRAEVNDVANAIIDGTDALMLSNETAVGKYPVKAVETLASIAATIEQATLSDRVKRRAGDFRHNLGTSISHAACTVANDTGLSVIVTMTHSGNTARGVSRFRPNSTIVALSPLVATCQQLQLSWGVIPIAVEEFSSTAEMITNAMKILLERAFVEPGDYFVFTAGVPIGRSGSTNLLKVQQAESEAP